MGDDLRAGHAKYCNAGQSDDTCTDLDRRFGEDLTGTCTFVMTIYFALRMGKFT